MALQIFLLQFFVFYAFGSFVNLKIQSRVDLSGQNSRFNVHMMVENDSKSPQSEYIIRLEDNIRRNIATISARSNTPKGSVDLQIESVKDGSYKIFFQPALPPKAQAQFTVQIVCTHLVTPFPVAIEQKDIQLVRFVGNAYFHSPYVTNSVKTTYIFPAALSNPGPVSWSKGFEPTILSEDKLSLTYGPFSNVPANSNTEISIQYTYNKPIVFVKEITRSIQVSHWGSINVEEKINLEHQGARLRNGYSGYDNLRGLTDATHMLVGWTMDVPSDACHIFYNDDLGNISSSSYDDESNRLIMRPRFPLFGGWHTEFKWGYTLPFSSYVTNDGDEFTLTIDFLGQFLDFDLAFGHAEVQVILPEGAANIEYEFPSLQVTKRDSRIVSFLDLESTGRPVLIFSKDNLVREQIQSFQVKYTYGSLTWLREPAILISFVFLVFIIFMILARLNFRIYSDSVGLAGTIGGPLEDIFNQREHLHTKLHKALDKFLVSGEIAEWDSAKKNVVASFNSLSKEYSKIPLVEDKSVQAKLLLIEEKQKAKFQAQLEYGDLVQKTRSVDSPAVLVLEENYKELTQDLDELFEELRQ